MSKEFVHEPENNRYLMKVDGQLASVVDYSVNGDVAAFTRTFTPPPARGKGYAAEIVSFAVAQVEEQGGLKIAPVCWYVDEWFQKNPEKSHLIAS